ncbi:unnamed protein product [marine sediment metagenome]|uniref:Uncharacterized protein n=1 Tax=marine sediment metagenome TaxID=412755 RepID=X1NPN5_9ZZZZ
MEELIKKIGQILNQFTQEELGNRLSQFAMISLREMILNEIRNYEIKGKDKDKK